MRLEATVPESRGTAIAQLAQEMGLSRSQIVDEALALFFKAVLEIRRGRRLVMLDPQSAQPACEFATPTLLALEWALNPMSLALPETAVAKLKELASAEKEPSPQLREAVKRHRR
jgi:hypothetical protein